MTQEYDEQTQYSSTDLGLASALVTLDFKLLMLDKTNLRNTRFLFLREPGIDRVASDYFSNQLEIKARAYFDNIRHLKNRLYSN